MRKPGINVPHTTLACIDCRHVELAVRAMLRSLEQCAFERAVLFTDRDRGALGCPEAIEVVRIPTIASSREYSSFMLKDLATRIDTDFVQVVQWDGYVVQRAAWSDDFLAFDYVGARWWFREPGRDVGNGGFSLRSRKLLAALARDERIQATDAEDSVICLQHRAMLEAEYGIRFADAATARRYAFEGEAPTGREFGFHRLFNFPYCNTPDELAAVMRALPDEDVVSPVGVTLVGNLARVGRRDEALAYASRIRAAGALFERLSPHFQAELAKAVGGA